jgi:phosphoglycerate dehydrogenase-like enzyme
VLPEAHYVIVAIPLTTQTRRMFDREALACMRTEAVLVQISRGEIVDEGALDAALRAGRIRGAALDVFAREPLPSDSPLWTAPNLIVSPHIAGWMPDYIARAVRVARENLARFEGGEPVLTPVDRTREY